MSGWIKVEKGLTETIRFKRVVRKLRDSSNALRSVTQHPEAFAVTVVLGALVRFWVYADSHIRDDDTLDITLDEINEIVGVDGFAQALPAEWLKVIDTERVQLPNFLDHNGSSEKQRRDNARRQAEYRHRHHSRNVTRDVTVTNKSNDARPDQTRRDKTREDIQDARATVPRGTHSEPSAEACDQAFEAIKANYPHFTGNQDWITAEHHFRLRVDEGESLENLQKGVARYRAFVDAGGVSSPKFVTTPGKFFTGSSKPWTQAWTPPPSKAETRLNANISAAEEFTRRTEVQ